MAVRPRELHLMQCLPRLSYRQRNVSKQRLSRSGRCWSVCGCTSAARSGGRSPDAVATSVRRSCLRKRGLMCRRVEKAVYLRPRGEDSRTVRMVGSGRAAGRGAQGGRPFATAGRILSEWTWRPGRNHGDPAKLEGPRRAQRQTVSVVGQRVVGEGGGVPLGSSER